MKLESLINSLSVKDKSRMLKSNKEYCFIECYYHGNPKVILTNDNAGRYITRVSSRYWSGMEFLLLLSECQDYLKK